MKRQKHSVPDNLPGVATPDGQAALLLTPIVVSLVRLPCLGQWIWQSPSAQVLSCSALLAVIYFV
ncbi:MAG: hypothetical protein OIF55_00635 [Amphritea sp.]|nr:hypothetical protein [Amphritea sp.]